MPIPLNAKNQHLKQYLNDKGEREHKLRSKELELEERKLLLAERKLNLEALKFRH
jgi:hypothetical protein